MNLAKYAWVIGVIAFQADPLRTCSLTIRSCGCSEGFNPSVSASFIKANSRINSLTWRSNPSLGIVKGVSRFAQAITSNQIQGTQNGVQQNLGTTYPSMIDLASATLQTNGNALSIAIKVNGPISTLGPEEQAQWNVTVVLENSTLALGVYTLWAEMNSTQLSGFITSADGSNTSSCQVEFSGSTLTLSAPITGLQSVTQAEWSVLTSYQAYSGGQLIDSAYDLAPSRGLQTTTLKT